MKSMTFYEDLTDTIFESNKPFRALYTVLASCDPIRSPFMQIGYIDCDLYSALCNFYDTFKSATTAGNEIDLDVIFVQDPIPDLYFAWDRLHNTNKWWKFGFSKYDGVVRTWPEMAIAADYFYTEMNLYFLDHPEDRENFMSLYR